MNQHEFDSLVRATLDSITSLLVVKGGEYAGSEDRLANFKRGAALTGATPLQVAFIYASKHFDGIASFVKTSASGTPRASSEPIEGRFDDLINYCILMKGLVREAAAEKIRNPNPLTSGVTMAEKEKLLAAFADQVAKGAKNA